MNNYIFFPQISSFGMVQDLISNAIIYSQLFFGLDLLNNYLIFFLLFLLGNLIYHSKNISYGILLSIITPLIFGIDLIIIKLLVTIPYFLIFKTRLEHHKKLIDFILILFTIYLGFFLTESIFILLAFAYIIVNKIKNNNQRVLINYFIFFLLIVSLFFQYYVPPELKDNIYYVPNELSYKHIFSFANTTPYVSNLAQIISLKPILITLIIITIIKFTFIRTRDLFILLILSLIIYSESFRSLDNYLMLSGLKKIFPVLSSIHLISILTAILVYGLFSNFRKINYLIITILIFINFSFKTDKFHNKFNSEVSPNNFAKNYFINFDKDLNWYSPDISNISINSKIKDKFLILDSNPNTRISNENGKQLGSEELIVNFNNKITLSALELNVGNFKSDYPRGLTIEASNDCDSNNFNIIYHKRYFFGSPKVLNNKYYFSDPSDVKIYFPTTIACKLLIKQTGRMPIFDWSISEIKFATK